MISHNLQQPRVIPKASTLFFCSLTIWHLKKSVNHYNSNQKNEHLINIIEHKIKHFFSQTAFLKQFTN